MLVPVVTMYIAIKHFPATKWTDRADLSKARVMLMEKAETRPNSLRSSYLAEAQDCDCSCLLTQ